MRQAECRCGQLRAMCNGEPVRVSVCHCLTCQRRTGSVFGTQARFRSEQVVVVGSFKTYARVAESGRTASYRFCPRCGSTVTFENEAMPGMTGVPVGAFADPTFPVPELSIFESRRHRWVQIVAEGASHCPEAAR